MRRLHDALLILFVCVCGTGTAENVALHAPYTLDPAPNWEDCAGAENSTALTDGKHAQGQFWNQPETLGWFKAKPVVITVDLGSDQAISGVSYSTVTDMAGVPGVTRIEWPTAIFLFVAGDDKQFRHAGELTGLSLAENGLPPEQEQAVHTFKTEGLTTHGRYVAFGVWAQPFVFVDEVEVLSGDSAWANNPLPGEQVGDLKAFMESRAVYAAVMRRLQNDAAIVRKKTADAPIAPDDTKAILAELDSVVQAIRDIPTTFDDSFRAVLPLNETHARILAAHARLWRAMGFPALTAWTPANAYDPLTFLGNPPVDPRPAVTMDMMRNEYRSAAFNVSNSAPETTTISAAITGLPGGDNPDWLAVHEVEWTDTAAGKPVAAALMPLVRRARYEIKIPPGMTRQVWLLAHSANVPPGAHDGAIDLTLPGGEPITIPLKLTVHPTQFPDKPRLHFGGWDYTDQDRRYSVTPENWQAYIAHLREHFVDSPWGSCMPFGKYDDAGNMIAPPDTARFDRWLTLWPDAAQYCIAVGAHDRLDNLALGTPEFAHAVGAWAAFWAEHAKSKNVRPDQVVLLLVDEPHEPKQDAVILAWAKAIRAGTTGMRIWEDPIWDDMKQADQEMIAACHVLCVNRPTLLADQAFADYFDAQRDKGIQLDFYSCNGPARLLDPYAYYRLQAWTAWRHGGKSMYFWSFASGGGASSFNEYRVTNCAYTPLFLDDTSVIPGKHMEACREGIEDYEYLAILRDAIDRAQASGVPPDTIAKAQQVLEQAPARVLEHESPPMLSWHHPRNRNTADHARVDILNALDTLR